MTTIVAIQNPETSPLINLVSWEYENQSRDENSLSLFIAESIESEESSQPLRIDGITQLGQFQTHFNMIIT